MKKASILIALMLSMTVVSFAQGEPAPNQLDEKTNMKSKKMNRFKSQLGLTDVQDAQIKDIRLKYRPHNEAIDLIEDEEIRTQEQGKLRKAENDEIMAILTAEQKVTYREMHMGKNELKPNAEVEKTKQMPLQGVQ